MSFRSKMIAAEQDRIFAQMNVLSQAANVGAQAALDAGDIMQTAADENIAFLKEQYAQSQAFLTPYVTAGNLGLDKLQDLLGLNGNDRLQAASMEVLNAPDVQMAIQQGVDAYTKSAVAGTQGIRSGRLAQELQQFGQSTSFGALNQRRADLQALAGLGANAAQAQGNLSLGLGESVANQNLIGAEGRANAKIQAGNIQASALAAQVPLYSDLSDLQHGMFTIGTSGLAGSMGGGGFLGGNGMGNGMGNPMADPYAYQDTSNYMPVFNSKS